MSLTYKGKEIKLEQIIAAPAKITYEGEDYYLSPLDDEITSELNAWIRDQYMAQVTDMCRTLPEAQQQRQIDRAFDKLDMLHSDTIIGKRFLNSLEGSLMLIHLSLKKKHPDIEMNTVRKIFTDESVIGEFLSRIEDLKKENSLEAAGIDVGNSERAKE